MIDSLAAVALSNPVASIHVLVVDDEALAAMALEDYLSRKGFRVTLANDGLEALERWTADPADAVVTDLRMPRMDGRQLVAALRARAPDLPMVVMTGLVDAETERNAFGVAGRGDGETVEVLKKPVSPDAILGAIRRVMGG